MFAKKTVAIRGPRPESVAITRDDHGVPHIQAENLNDLTWGIGYAQATDRATQLQLMRIIGQGRLCELLDDSEDNFAIDKFFRRMNWRANDVSELAKLTPETRDWCQALCDGINAGLSARSVTLLKLLGYKPEPWRIQDIFLIVRMTSYLTLAQSQAEIEKVFLELAQSEISDARLATLFPVDWNITDRDLLRKVSIEDPIVPPETLWQSAAPRTMASNNWVVSGALSASGAAMMANDPHLEVNRLPNVWYEMGLSCPEYQGLGYGMPGLPGLLVGRTPKVTWGATYTFMDTVDSWIEHCKEGKYRRGKRWQAFEVREELIKRKKHPDQQVTFYENRHGVLAGNPKEESYLLTTAWSPALYGARSLNANFALIQSEDVPSAMRTLGEIESAWNWVVSDVSGNIGYQMSGLCPKRHQDWNGFTPAPGWDKGYDWQGFEKPEDLPRSFNPDCGYIVTANQDLNALGKVSPINMPMGDYRARRIEQCLENSGPHDIKSLGEIQMDTYSLQAEQFMAILQPLIEDQKDTNQAARILGQWDLHYAADSKGAVIFERFYEALRKEVFSGSDQEHFPSEVMQHLQEQSGLFIDFYQNFDLCLLDPDSEWFKPGTQKDAFMRAFNRIRDMDTHQCWGDINRFQFTNILLQGKAPQWMGFDSESKAMIGGRATPHQGQIYSSAGRQTSFAPSIRIIADMSENVLHTRTAGGVSDNRFSPWYQSEIDDWLNGTFKRLDYDCRTLDV